MDNSKQRHASVIITATALSAVTAVWYLALILNLRQVGEFAGMRFFWTAALGILPFASLALSALLTDGYLRGNRENAGFIWASLTAGLSPWIWWLASLSLGLS